jgi:hypothetical protein
MDNEANDTPATLKASANISKPAPEAKVEPKADEAPVEEIADWTAIARRHSHR